MTKRILGDAGLQKRRQTDYDWHCPHSSAALTRHRNRTGGCLTPPPPKPRPPSNTGVLTLSTLTMLWDGSAVSPRCSFTAAWARFRRAAWEAVSGSPKSGVNQAPPIITCGRQGGSLSWVEGVRQAGVHPGSRRLGGRWPWEIEPPAPEAVYRQKLWVKWGVVALLPEASDPPRRNARGRYENLAWLCWARLMFDTWGISAKQAASLPFPLTGARPHLFLPKAGLQLRPVKESPLCN